MSDIQPTEVYRYKEVRYTAMLDESECRVGDGRMELKCLTFKVLRLTPCGVWIDYYSKEKFINFRSRKQFACKTKVEALESFLARKNRQAVILSAQLRNVEEAEKIGKAMLNKINPEPEKSNSDLDEIF
jgi:hypothetical protein